MKVKLKLQVRFINLTNCNLSTFHFNFDFANLWCCLVRIYAKTSGNSVIKLKKQKEGSRTAMPFTSCHFGLCSAAPWPWLALLWIISDDVRFVSQKLREINFFIHSVNWFHANFFLFSKWKFLHIRISDVTYIREINFRESRSSKTAIFAVLDALKFVNLVDFSLQTVKNS